MPCLPAQMRTSSSISRGKCGHRVRASTLTKFTAIFSLNDKIPFCCRPRILRVGASTVRYLRNCKSISISREKSLKHLRMCCLRFLIGVILRKGSRLRDPCSLNWFSRGNAKGSWLMCRLMCLRKILISNVMHLCSKMSSANVITHHGLTRLQYNWMKTRGVIRHQRKECPNQRDTATDRKSVV